MLNDGEIEKNTFLLNISYAEVLEKNKLHNNINDIEFQEQFP